MSNATNSFGVNDSAETPITEEKPITNRLHIAHIFEGDALGDDNANSSNTQNTTYEQVIHLITDAQA